MPTNLIGVSFPGGSNEDTFTWDPGSKTWRFFLEQKDAAGKWKTFADQGATLIK